MHLGKEQLDELTSYIRRELEKIGDDTIESAKRKARESFFRTKEGKMVQHLRTVYGNMGRRCGEVCSEVLEHIEGAATKGLEKPFKYVSRDELRRRVALVSLDASNAEEVVTKVRREYLSKLKPGVRRKFNLKLN